MSRLLYEYPDNRAFSGDLLLEECNDGGEVRIDNGLFVPDQSFGTAVYLSLFGGNKDDPGTVMNNSTWWGNTLTNVTEAEKMVSRFQALITGMPMTTKNIREAETAALLDLAWIKDVGIADSITVTGNAVSVRQFSLKIDIKAHGETVYTNTFSLLWKAGIYGSI